MEFENIYNLYFKDVYAFLYALSRSKVVAEDIIVKILLIPISYIVSHIMITGLNAATYSAARDFYLILLLAIPLYFLFHILYKKRFT